MALDAEPPPRTVQAVELAIFLLLIVPALAQSLFASAAGDASFALVAIFTILRDASLLALVLFFLWRNREPIARIGWTPDALGREAAIGVALFFPIAFGAGALEAALRSAGLSGPAMARRALGGGSYPLGLAILLVIAAAVAEETIFRGYLLLRLRAVLGTTAGPVVLSSVIFALGHGYEGTSGLITVAVFGAVLALVYLWRKSLVAPIVIHLLQDLMSVVLVPHLGR